MKKVLIIFGILFFAACSKFITVDTGGKKVQPRKYGTALVVGKVPMGVGTTIKSGFTTVNLAIDQINTNSANIELKAPINNANFTGLSLFEQLKIASKGVVIDSITSDGSNIRFWNGVTELSAIPGIGGATWGTISGSLTNQIDLQAALNAKGSGTLVAHDTTHLSARIDLKGSGTLVAHDTTHLSSRIDLKANTSALSGYVPTTRTVNGHALSSNVSVTATDLSLNNVTNESKATMFTSPTFTGTVILPSTTSIGTVSSTELGYVDNVTSSIQTQLNAKPRRDSVLMKNDTISIESFALLKTDTITKVATKYDLDTLNLAPILSGTRANAPLTEDIGRLYYNTSIYKPLWWSGSEWLDATGTLLLSGDMVTDGGFTNPANWGAGAGWLVSGNVATQDGSNSYTSIATGTGILTVGKLYRITFTIVSITSGGSARMKCGNTNGASRTSAGTYTEELICTTSTYLGIQTTVLSKTTVIDDLICYEVY